MPVDVVVVGSINADVTISTDIYPSRGHTVTGWSFEVLPGGKGANQAVAARRFGKCCALVGCVGSDAFGSKVIDELIVAGVDVTNVRRVEGSASGATFVMVDADAENTMIVIPGANESLTSSMVDESEQFIASARLLLVQAEVPADAVLRAMQLARRHGKLVIFDPAPSDRVDVRCLALADILVPNQQETTLLTGIEVVDIESAACAARAIKERWGIQRSIVKLGAGGALVYEHGTCIPVPGLKVDAVSTVGAGDCFAGALASAICDGCSFLAAVRFANAAAALKVTRIGAMLGIPSLEEVRLFANQRGYAIC
ncbi:MAG: ribokinase [Alicyclobacillus sp.]|nr:ribokinase [Alicyclobacillus sp.]